MQGLILLGDFFEETEALATCDVLLRAGEKITYCSVMSQKEVYTKSGYQIICDSKIDEIDYNNFDYLILPGGKASFTILNNDQRVETIIDYYVNNNKLVAAICAAPHLLGRKGYFADREYTVYPGFEKLCTKGTYRRDKGVVIDDRFVTAKSMYYSIDFALGIIEFLYGKIKAEEIRKNCMGED